MRLLLLFLFIASSRADASDEQGSSPAEFRRLFVDHEGDGEDEYEIVEDLESCYWCGTDVADSDSEHRAAVISRFTISVEPGTCQTNQSPNYPKIYPANIDYRWTYTTHADSVLTFTVPSGGIQKSPGCHRDKLATVVDNKSKRKCGSFKNWVRDSGDTSTMYIRFETNRRIEWNGYTGTVCASALPTTTSTTAPTTVTTTVGSTATPVLCDDICGDVNGYTSRISEGTQDGSHFPWVVTIDLLRDNYYVRCSGYLISRKHVVTSAYCFFQQTVNGSLASTTARVRVGDTDLTQPDSPLAQVLYTTDITIHEGFLPYVDAKKTLDNLAILTMPGDGFTLNSKVAPICLITDAIYTSILVNTAFGLGLPELSLAGFGWNKLDEPMINMTQLPVTPFMSQGVAEMIILNFGAATSPCYGDTGGAVYVTKDSKVYAIAMLNVIAATTCPQGIFAGFYFAPSVKYYKAWIDGITGTRYCTQ